MRVTRVDPLRRKGDKDLLADLQVRIGDSGNDDLLGRSRIGRTLQHDEHPRMHMRHDPLLQSRYNIGDIRVPGLVERCRYADGYNIAIADDTEVFCGLEFSCIHTVSNRLVADIGDIGFTTVHSLDFFGVLVDPVNCEPGICQLHGQGKTHVPETDDGTGCCAGLYLLLKFLFQRHFSPSFRGMGFG